MTSVPFLLGSIKCKTVWSLSLYLLHFPPIYNEDEQAYEENTGSPTILTILADVVPPISPFPINALFHIHAPEN
jgi:hypothetical protein